MLLNAGDRYRILLTVYSPLVVGGSANGSCRSAVAASVTFLLSPQCTVPWLAWTACDQLRDTSGTVTTIAGMHMTNLPFLDNHLARKLRFLTRVQRILR